MSHKNMTPRAFALMPAVDIQQGRAVRLVQGAAGSETDYGDPVQAARSWVGQDVRSFSVFGAAQR